MIQRIQSVYLLVSALISGGLVFLINFWTEEGSKIVNLIATLLHERFLIKSIGFFFLVSAILSLATIFKFKNRQTQFVMCRLNILINFYLLGVLLYLSLNLPGEMKISENGIGIYLPIVVVILQVMANKAIKKDEDLVKSVDRLR